MTTDNNTLIYPVILHPEDDGYCVEIPDINNGTWTQGENLQDALAMVQDAIGIMLEDESNYPAASDLNDLMVKDSDIKTAVKINMAEYRKNNHETVGNL